jgi:hypothetical protein
MRRAIQAIAGGAGAVARAPILVVITYVALVAVVTPAVAVVATHLEEAFTARTLELVPPARADTAWLDEAGDATGAVLGSTFAPAMIGFAAQLSNIDDLARAEAREPIAWLPVIAWAVAWTFLLGGILARYAGRAASAPRSFVAASVRTFPRFLLIAAGTFLIYFAGAFAYRTAPREFRVLTLAVVLVVAGVTVVVASYARARIALHEVTVRAAIAQSLRMVRAEPRAVAAQTALACAGWIVLMSVLAWLDRQFGAGTGLWRPLLVAQGYVVARIILRLVWEASALTLVRMDATRTSP